MYSMRMAVEEVVSFGDFLPGVFGSCDLLGRIGERAIVLDWKFGDGVMVEVEENEQLMFYAAAAMRTEKVSWVFDGAREIECVIVQPPFIKRWTTSFDRIRQFERELAFAVRESQKPTAVIRTGEHCRFCNAKSICPEQSNAAARALAVQVKALPVADLGQYLAMADQIEAWIEDVRALALQAMEAGGSVPGYKLVAKRATRKWADEAAAREALLSQLPESEVMEASLISPAQAEKKLKKVKGTLPETVSLSAGSALALESDPRPPVLLIGQQLSAALGNLV
jgi:hypothetical protein